MRRLCLVLIALAIAVLLIAPVSPAPASAAGPAYYVVRPGDTLSSIAARYGLSTWAIASANHLWNPNLIYVGQVLVIPYVPGPIPPPVPNPFCLVRVNYGDTLYSIAARMHTDIWTLARVNGIYNPNWIYAGQWLRVPNCSSGSTPNPTPAPSARRTITGTWSTGVSLMQVAEVVGCTSSSCAVQGQFFDAVGAPGAAITGTVDVTTGAVSLTISGSTPGAPSRTFTGTINATSTTMTGQLTGAGAVTFTKQ